MGLRPIRPLIRRPYLQQQLAFLVASTQYTAGPPATSHLRVQPGGQGLCAGKPRFFSSRKGWETNF
eukprot:c18113_g1_i1 orf=525-722(-)